MTWSINATKKAKTSDQVEESTQDTRIGRGSNGGTIGVGERINDEERRS
jgi:hypothetical protein